jgi:hypothetical protein
VYDAAKLIIKTCIVAEFLRFRYFGRKSEFNKLDGIGRI